MKKILFLITLVFISTYACLADNFKTTHSDSIDVLHYTINLNIDYTIQEIGGNTTLLITPNIDNLDVVSLDLLQLTIDSIWIDSVLTANFTYNDTLLNIMLSTPAMTGDTLTATVFYHGHPQEDPSGFGGFSFSGAYAYSIGVAFISNPHNYGRVWYPCIDDFVDRATYDFYITAIDGKVAVCNGTLMSETDNGNGTNTWYWAMHDEIPSYLSCVAVADYVAVRDTFNGMSGQIPVAVYVRPGDSLDAVNSFVNILDILAGFENRFGPYRWERVGLVAVPLGGGMEHATNIAYGDFLINGALTYEWLYAHEISHQWWGDLATCREAEEMWLNEGWAVYSEAIYKENLYGPEAYRDYVKNNHQYVVRYAHIEDGGFRALVGVPHEYTYGTTVYDKGGDVAHTIRGYMGDSLFFPAIQQYLSDFAFKDATSEDMKNVLTSSSGIDMTDFFDAWVYSPGFPHFSVDSFTVSGTGPLYNVTVYMRQKLRGSTFYAGSNRVGITFMDANFATHTVLMEFSGQTGTQTFAVPIYPQIAMCDYHEKLSDAITDYAMFVDSTMTYSNFYTNTYFRLQVTDIADSAFIRVEHNWVAADSLLVPIANLNLHTNRYWKIEGVLPPTFHAAAIFRYNKSTSAGSTESYLDNMLLTSVYIDSLVILYREHAGDNWQLIPFTRAGSSISGYITVDSLRLGEYTFAFYDSNVYVSSGDTDKPTGDLLIYPNPSDDKFTMKFRVNTPSLISIYTMNGKLVHREHVYPGQDFMRWDPAGNENGMYLVVLDNGSLHPAVRKIIFQK